MLVIRQLYSPAGLNTKAGTRYPLNIVPGKPQKLSSYLLRGENTFHNQQSKRRYLGFLAYDMSQFWLRSTGYIQLTGFKLSCRRQHNSDHVLDKG